MRRNLMPNLTGHPPVEIAQEPTHGTYSDARDEARDLCRNLGIDITNEHWDSCSVADFIRAAYAHGWKACESKLASPDVADGIAQAIRNPESIVGEPSYLTGDRRLRWQVQAVQRVAAYGVPKDAPWRQRVSAGQASRDRGEFGRAS